MATKVKVMLQFNITARRNKNFHNIFFALRFQGQFMLYLTFFETNMVIEKIDFLLAIQLRALLHSAADMQASFVRNYRLTTAVRYCSTLNCE